MCYIREKAKAVFLRVIITNRIQTHLQALLKLLDHSYIFQYALAYAKSKTQKNISA